MLLNKRNLEIIKIAGLDDGRYALNGLYIDTEAKKTVVTDGNRLITVSFPEGFKDEDFPCVNGLTASPLTKNCILPTEGVEKLLKTIPKKTSLPIFSHVAIDGAKTDADETTVYMAVTDLESPQVMALRKRKGTYPPYRTFFLQEEPTVTIRVNANYLAEILHLAKGYGGEKYTVEIEVRDGEKPLVIRAKDRVTEQCFEAVLMPLRYPKAAVAQHREKGSEIKLIEKNGA